MTDTTIRDVNRAGNPVAEFPARRRPQPGPRPQLVTSPSKAGQPGAVILNRAAHYLCEYVTFADEHSATVIALMAARDHVFRRAATAQLYPAFTSPVHNSGKTRLRQMVGNLVPAGRHLLVASTAAPVYEIIDKEHPTIMFDRIGSMVRPGSVIADILDACNQDDERLARMRNKPDGETEAHLFDMFTPIWLAGIDLPGTLQADLLSRCLLIELQREHVNYIMTRAKKEQIRRQGYKIRDAIGEWLKPNITQLAEAEPLMPKSLQHDGRITEGLLLPLAIAELAGGDWPAKARKAFEGLIIPRIGQTNDISLMLLRDTATVTTGSEKMPTSEIITALIAMDSGPWGAKWEHNFHEFGGRPRAVQMEFAGMLRKFGLASKNVWVGGKPVKGFDSAEIDAAWQRYR